MVTGVGFEPTPPKRLVPKTSALDHSATQPYLVESYPKLALLPDPIQSPITHQLTPWAPFSHQCGGLAQSVECVVSNDEAPGSKPGFSTFCRG